MTRRSYPIHRLKVGDALLIENPRPYLRGCLYNRAESLEIRITACKTAGGLEVRRVA